MSKTVAIVGHPNLTDESIANRIIVDRLLAQDDVEVRNLAELYPDYNIDVEAEQKALIDADTIALVYPFFWYSVPAILKRWLDQVLTYGFAYGSDGDKLKGKRLIASTTVGGPEDAYAPGGDDSHTMEQFLFPLHQTAVFTGMNWEAPVISYGMMFIPGVGIERGDIEQRAREHADRLIAQIEEPVEQEEPSMVSVH